MRKKIKNLIFLFSLIVVPTLFLILQGCSPCVSCLDKKDDFTKDNLGKYINSTVDDFSPFLIDDNTLLFTSNRGGGCNSKINESNKYGEDVFTSNLKKDIWQEADLQSASVTTSKNEGTVSLSKKYVIIARSYDDQGFGGSDLYEAELSDNNIQNLKNLGSKINSTRWDAQPAISPDGKILIFSSDRPGGKGGADLYKSTRKTDGSWSEPVNLSALNTSGNEYSPFISSDGLTLFFASDGRGDTYGGLDLYVASLLDFNQIKHLGEPYNSTYNDAFPFLKKSGCKELDTLFYSSDRIGGCGGYDLYSSSYVPPKYIIAGVVKDKKTGQLLKVNSKVDFSEKSGTQLGQFNLIPPQSKFTKDVCTGSYLMKATAAGYFPGSASVDIPFNINDKTYNTEILLDPYPVVVIEGEVKDVCGALPYESEVVLIDVKTKTEVQKVSTVNGKYSFNLDYTNQPQNYEIKAIVPDYSQKEKVFVDVKADVKTDQKFTQDVFVEPLPINPAKIPYFITGYYRLNTTDNLKDLRTQWRSKFKKLEYIENPNKKIFDAESNSLKTYDEFASDVDNFASALKTKMVDTVLPKFERVLSKSPDAKLIIEINGYVDEREFFGKYIEKDIEVNNGKVSKGDNIMNKQLSMLRAYYTSEFLVESLSYSSAKFKDWYAQGKIIINKYGKGVSQKLENQKSSDRDYMLALFRHIIVYVKIEDPSRCNK